MSATQNNAFVILRWVERRTNTLRGFADVQMPSGMQILEVGIHASHGKAWASPPSKPQVGRDGVVLKDQETGKTKYAPIILFASKEQRDRWSSYVINAMMEAYPQALDQ